MEKFFFRRSASYLKMYMILFLYFCVFLSPAYAKDPQLAPVRLSTIGGSSTLAMNAQYTGRNLNASWVNGFHGFWQRMQGLTNVESHNQRIMENWGREERTNFTNATGGAGMTDFYIQAAAAVAQKASYVTVMLGDGDICQRNIWEIPSDETFEAAFRTGLQRLKEGLPNGATVYIIALMDLTRLFDVAKDKKTINGVDCERIWSNERFVCKTVLDPQNSDSDRAFVRERNIAFNDILERVTAEYQQNDSHHYYYFTDVVFNYTFLESDVSDIDCFHPSAAGQRVLSNITWKAGPFRQY